MTYFVNFGELLEAGMKLPFCEFCAKYHAGESVVFV